MALQILLYIYKHCKLEFKKQKFLAKLKNQCNEMSKKSKG